MKFFLLLISILASQSYASDLYNIPFKSISGNTKDLSEYKGKAIVIVNTASKCGYTGQLEELQSLYENYSKKGLVVLGFPSKSFKQELASEGEVQKFCKLNYGVRFPMSSIIEVSGTQTHPLFKALVKNDPDNGGPVRWNFEKFIVSKEGKVIKRFRSKTRPSSSQFNSFIAKSLVM